MALPTNISTGTITGTFLNVAGEPSRGTVTFTPNFVHGTDTGADVIFVPVKVTVSLNSMGSFSVDLAATNDVDLAPLNFLYQVTVNIYGVSIPTFTMALPAGTIKDMTDVMPA